MAAPGASPDHYSFSTRDLPADTKFDAWRDLWMRQIEVETHLGPGPLETFDAKADLWQAGPLSIASINSWNVVYRRTETLACNGNNFLGFTLCRRDMTVGLQQDDRLGIRPGGGFFLAGDRSFTVQPSPGCDSRLVLIDRNALLELMPRGFDVGMQTFEPGNGLIKLISDMLALITSKTEPTTKDNREAVGGQIVDLVALLLCPSRDGRALIEERGLAAARRGAVLQAIDQHFADAGLSAESVGQTLGISDRHVHRLLEETTKTFQEHLLERRLQRAHELLSDPVASDVKIAEIAANAGFINVTHFNYAFRRRFGDTPKGARATAATERSLQVLRRSLASP